jgi:hypothetical protein
MTTNQELMTTEQQKAIIDTNKMIAHLEPLIDEIATIKVLNNVGRILNVASLVKIKNLKESKAYIGMPYIDEDGNSSHLRNWAECCRYKLKMPMSTIDKSLLNLNKLGEEVLEASQRMGLGDRELRKFRQLPTEQRTVLINSEEFDLGDKELVKEKIEDLSFKYNTKLAEQKKALDEANLTVDALRENSAVTHRKDEERKEQEAKMRFDQKKLSPKASGLIEGITKAGSLITQASNQLKEIDEFIRKEGVGFGELDHKELEKVTRMLVNQIKESFNFFSSCTEDTLGTFGAMLDDDINLHGIISSHLVPGEMDEHENTISPEEFAEMNK